MPLVMFVSRRILISIVTMLIVATVVYFITAVLPGDVATRILGRSPDPEQLALLRERLGLNEPLASRFFGWLSGLLQGDLGNSLVTGQPVAAVVGKALWNSTLMALFVLVLYVPITVIPATIQALNVDSKVDNAYSSFSLAIQSVPDFLLGTILLLVFARWLPILPPRSTIDSANSGLEILRALILPGITIALVMATYATRFLRDSLIDVLNSDYVKMARLNGISERTILWRHAFPNALVPALTVTSLSLTYLFGGVVVVEQVFSFPGVGQLLVGALMQLDVPVIQATVLIAAGVYIAGNLIVDVLTLYFNPRLRQL
ncbi:ABC transporter permease [Ensifer soli]|uniref:ABC transporter permease n=1 Tax=Ciceribacter sp. sgz301302 TaxID=3342379 RepID=UPI0035BA4CEC